MADDEEVVRAIAPVRPVSLQWQRPPGVDPAEHRARRQRLEVVPVDVLGDRELGTWLRSCRVGDEVDGRLDAHRRDEQVERRCGIAAVDHRFAREELLESPPGGLVGGRIAGASDFDDDGGPALRDELDHRADVQVVVHELRREQRGEPLLGPTDQRRDSVRGVVSAVVVDVDERLGTDRLDEPEQAPREHSLVTRGRPGEAAVEVGAGDTSAMGEGRLRQRRLDCAEQEHHVRRRSACRAEPAVDGSDA